MKCKKCSAEMKRDKRQDWVGAYHLELDGLHKAYSCPKCKYLVFKPIPEE